jgi:aspartyl-tRNA(Asn)/glutamyl-tRNA(Gln) amidotransferase subunit A
VTEPYRLTIAAAGRALRSGQLTAEDLVRCVLARAEETEDSVRAWVELYPEEAIAAAQAADRALRDGDDSGPLHGIPIGVKDIVDIAGRPTRCGSDVRHDVPPASADAAVVTRLRDAGAIILGKTVTHEFAGGVLSPPARNPWDHARIPGGSSGGSAAAVAAGSCLGAVGTDTAGSIRVPAALTGTVGLKPTTGLVDTAGVFPLSWSLDTVGPIARTAEDAALLLAAMTTGARHPDPASLAGARIAVPVPYFLDRLQPGVRDAFALALDVMRGAGAQITETEWPEARAAMAAGFLIVRPEMALVHARTLREFPERFGLVLRSRLEAFSLFPARGYLRAQTARAAVRDRLLRRFDDEEFDLLALPTVVASATLAEATMVQLPDGDEPIHAGFTKLTMPFNTVGLPAVSVPCGLDASGLPVGLQLVARPNRDRDLLVMAAAFEDVSGWAGRLPG